MTDSFRQQLEDLRSRMAEIQADAAEGNGALWIDVREADEWRLGHIEGAHHLTRGFLELRIESLIPERDRAIVLYCQTGVRSLLAADSLQRLGYRNASSLAGGFEAWKAEGRPYSVPDVASTQDRERYHRHLLMPEVGESGQAKLRAAAVLVVGAGGLGCPAALYLAAAGVGRIGIVDDDRVDRSNLQRQVLHSDERVGMAKTDSARRSLLALNPSVTVEAHPVRLTDANAEDLISGYDLVVDGCDNFPTRYVVNDTCVALGTPNVHGSIHRFEGQVSVFWPGRGPCYRCLHPQAPPPDLAPNCAEIGVLGVLPGVIGLIEATESVKVILGIGEPLVGRLLTYDALAGRFSEFRLRRDPECPACRGVAAP